MTPAQQSNFLTFTAQIFVAGEEQPILYSFESPGVINARSVVEGATRANGGIWVGGVFYPARVIRKIVLSETATVAVAEG